jgi:hypothetical protein
MDLTKPCPEFCGGSMMTCTCPGGNWYLNATAGIEWCSKGCGRSRHMCCCPPDKYAKKIEQAVNLITVALAGTNSGAALSPESHRLLDQLWVLLADRKAV